MDFIAEILKRADNYLKELPPPPPISAPPGGAEIAGFFDLTLLKPETTATQVEALCQDARHYGFASVFVNPAHVPLAADWVAGSAVKVGSVAGFPLGASLTTQKMFDASVCINAGATEIDMVLNVGAMKGQDYALVYSDVLSVCQVVHGQKAILKVILETGLLNDREKVIACLLCKEAGVDFVKTSTGFNSGGATVEDVDLMVRVVGADVKVKAAGGIRSLESAVSMLKAGASRIGVSAGVQIIKEALAEGNSVHD